MPPIFSDNDKCTEKPRLGRKSLIGKKKAEEKVQTKFKVALEGLGGLSFSTGLYILRVTGNCRKERIGEGRRGHTKPVVTLTPLPNKKGF